MLNNSTYRKRTLAAILLLAAAAPAQANIPLPAAFAFELPLWLSFMTFGGLFIVVTGIEAGVLYAWRRGHWKGSLRDSAVANGVSSLAGFFLSLSGVVLPLLCVLFVLIWDGLRKRWGFSSWYAVPIGLLPFALFVVVAAAFWNTSLDLTAAAIYGPLIPAFVVTVLIEALLIRYLRPEGAVFWPVVTGNAATYSLLAFILLGLRFGPMDNPLLTVDYLKQKAWFKMHRGKTTETLRLLELARERNRRSSGWLARVREPSEPHPYYAYSDIKIAKRLREQGEIQAARQVLDGLLALQLLGDGNREEVEEVLQSLPSVATGNGVSSPVVPTNVRDAVDSTHGG